MSNDIMKYLHFETRISERRITRCLMKYVRHRVFTNQLDMRELTSRQSDMDNRYPRVKLFHFYDKGKKMLAVLLLYSRYGLGENCLPSGVMYLFSDDYVYASKPVPVTWLWNMDIRWDESVYSMLCEYDAEHPRAGLKPYLERYRQMHDNHASYEPLQMNFIIPLLTQYHKGLELLVKAELFHLAKYLIICDQSDGKGSGKKSGGSEAGKIPSLLNVDPDSYSNLKEWMGVSQRVLVKLNQMLETSKPYYSLGSKGWWYVTGCSVKTRTSLTDREFFARLADIQNYNSEYLNLEQFTPSIMWFFMENHITHHRPVNIPYRVRRRITGIAVMKDAQVMNILRFLGTLDNVDAKDYLTYLYYCGKCKLEVKEYPFGLRPHEIFKAAAEAKRMYEDLYGSVKEERAFRIKTNRPEYRFFETNSDDISIGTDYCVRVPENTDAMFRESYHLGHCVKTYCEDVARGNTYILFLRRAECPDIPFVTMEVTKNYILNQVKARGNEHASLSAQRYVRRWAEQKGIWIDTEDLSETA